MISIMDKGISCYIRTLQRERKGKERSDAVRVPEQRSCGVDGATIEAKGLSAMLTEQSESGVSKTPLSCFPYF